MSSKHKPSEGQLPGPLGSVPAANQGLAWHCPSGFPPPKKELGLETEGSTAQRATQASIHGLGVGQENRKHLSEGVSAQAAFYLTFCLLCGLAAGHGNSSL